MPIYDGAVELIRVNLLTIQAGDRASLQRIGFLTDVQFAEVNRSRLAEGLHVLEQNEIVFIGKHLFQSRSRDGYTIDDMIDQIVSAMSSLSVVNISRAQSRIDNPQSRPDRYGNQVNDRGVFEMTQRKPRAELYSVMPKGDHNKPPKN